MSSFQDRFKDKANIVGKQGEGAMLVQKPPPPRAPTGPKRIVDGVAIRDGGVGSTGHHGGSSSRTQMSMLPYGQHPRGSSSTASTSANESGGGAGFRDHIRGLVSNDSNQFQQNAAAAAGGSAMYGRRAHSNQPRVNPLVLEPLGPLKLGKNKFREDVSPRWKDRQHEIDEALQDLSTRMDESGRGVNYEPYTLEDWRRARENLAIVKGGVGRNPSDSDEQRLYRALRSKMKEFGEETEKVNKMLLQEEIARLGTKPIAPVPSEELLEKTTRRNKAIEFAKTVPKPRVNGAGIGLEKSTMDEEARKEREEEEHLFSPEARQKDAQLADLEEQHARDQAAVLALKKKMGMLT